MRSKIATKCIEYLNDVILLDEPLRRKNQKLAYVISCLEGDISGNKTRGLAVKMAKNKE